MIENSAILAAPKAYKKIPVWVMPYALVVVLSAAYLLPCVRVLSDFGDEGISVLNADRVLHGEIPGHDFVEVIGPGEFYWIALFLRLLGTSIISAHIELLLAGIALSALTFHLARRAGADPVLVCALFTAVSIPMFAINSYHWDSDLFALLAFATLVEWQRKPRGALLIIAGGFAAATSLIMQQKGMLLCGGLLLSAALIDRANWKRSTARILVPYTAILLAIVIYYAWHGALRDLVWANIVWPVSHYSDVNRSPYAFGAYPRLSSAVDAFDGVLPAYIGIPLATFSMIPIFIVVVLPGLVAVAWLRLRLKAFPVHLIPFWICGVALYFSEWQRPDILHLVFGCPILLAVVFALFRQIWAPAWARNLTLVSVALFSFTHMLSFLYCNQEIETRRGTVYSRDEGPFRGERFALQFIQKHAREGEDVFVYPYRPLINFLSDTHNPTRTSYFIYGWQTTRQFEEAIRDLEAKRVRYVVWDTKLAAGMMLSWFPHYREPAPARQIMERYLESRYKDVAMEGGYRIMERVQN